MRAARQWRMTTFANIDQSAHGSAHGNNRLPEPTAAQAEAGNYKKGRVAVHGLRIAIENPRGSLRKWRAEDGTSGASLMKFHYGYFEGVMGADGDELDVFIGPWPENDAVFVVNQSFGGKFDEHKVMLGFPDQRTAVAGYLSNYQAGWQGLGSIVACSVAQLKWWLAHGNKSRPLTQDQLPYEERKDMDKVIWDSANQPVGATLAQVLYQIRAHDGNDGLMFDRLTMSEILEDADGVLNMDALVIPFAKLEARMSVLQKVMDRAGNEVKVTAMQVSDPFTQRGTTNVAVVYELSDGQTISVFFHNPDTTPKKITAGDDLISWKWLLNKKDVTIAVAPERGRDLNVRTVAARLMLLAEKNSARFVTANSKRAERMQTIEGLKQELSTKESVLDGLENQIKELEVTLETTYSKTVQASNATQDAYIRAQDNGGTDPKTGKTIDELRAQIEDEAGQAKTIGAVLNGADKQAWRGGVPAFYMSGPEGNRKMSLTNWETGDDMPEYSGIAYDYTAGKFVLTELENGERTINYLQAATHTEAVKEVAELKAKLAADPAVETSAGEQEPEVKPEANVELAVAALEQSLSVVETNEPINRAEGNIEQAQLEAETAESIREAITVLTKDETPPEPASDAVSDITYRAVDDMFTAFTPNTAAGEEAWKTIAAHTDGTGKVLHQHVESTVSQLREAGYTVSEGAAPLPATDAEVDALLNELVAEPVAEQAADPVDPAKAAAERFLQSIIDGTASMDDAGLPAELKSTYEAFKGEAVIVDLFRQAVKAYSTHAIAKANAALAK